MEQRHSGHPLPCPRSAPLPSHPQRRRPTSAANAAATNTAAASAAAADHTPPPPHQGHLPHLPRRRRETPPPSSAPSPPGPPPPPSRPAPLPLLVDITGPRPRSKKWPTTAAAVEHPARLTHIGVLTTGRVIAKRGVQRTLNPRSSIRSAAETPRMAARDAAATATGEEGRSPVRRVCACTRTDHMSTDGPYRRTTTTSGA